MVILAFMQNAWFKDPEGVKSIFDRYPEQRNSLIGRFLFMGCRSGKVLLSTLGDRLCYEVITWEEASPEIGGHSASKFAADRQHIDAAIRKFQPGLILTFGQIAGEGVMSCCSLSIPVLYGPHPAARNNPFPRLREMRQQIEDMEGHAIEKVISLGR